MLHSKTERKIKQALPGVLVGVEGEEPPEVEEVEAEEEVVVVAPAYVTVLVSLAHKWSQESSFWSARKKRDCFFNMDVFCTQLIRVLLTCVFVDSSLLSLLP